MSVNRRKNKFLPFLLAVFLLNGCATLSRITKTDFVDKKRHFSATLPIDWMRFNQLGHFFITRDGGTLNAIQVFRHKVSQELPTTKKRFQEGMLPQDMAELERDEFKADPQVGTFSVSKTVPLNVSGFDAYRMEYDYILTSGLKYKGIAVGFLDGEWVYRIFYQAPAQHYFEATKPDFERFIETFKVLESKDKEKS